MPTDDHGNVADIILDGNSVVNRMNTGQWYCQGINFISELISKRIRAAMEQDPNKWRECYDLALEFITDVSPNWARVVRETTQEDFTKQHLVEQIIKEGIYLQITPYQENISTALIKFLKEKYDAKKTKVTFSVVNPDGSYRKIRSKFPVMIGSEYWYMLYKMPHMRVAGVAHISQHRSPISMSSISKFSQHVTKTPTRFGEDEGRYLNLVAGAEATAHILGVYANSYTATENMIEHLMNSKKPSALNELSMTTNEIIQTNSIVKMAKHIFSCVGINISPKVAAVQNEPRQLLVHGESK